MPKLNDAEEQYTTSPGATSSSSAAAAAAPKETAADYQSRLRTFLYRSFEGDKEIINDMWHILTTIPTHAAVISDRISELVTLNKPNLLDLEAKQNKTMEKVLQQYANLENKNYLYSILFDAFGIYCYTVRDNAARMQYYAKHPVQGVITERVMGIAIGGKDHDRKTQEMIRRIDNVFKDFTWLENLQKRKLAQRRNEPFAPEVKSALDALFRELELIKGYLALHRQCMEAAINYCYEPTFDAAAQMLAIGKTTNQYILCLHPHETKQSTPIQETPIAKRFLPSHRARLSSGPGPSDAFPATDERSAKKMLFSDYKDEESSPSKARPSSSSSSQAKQSSGIESAFAVPATPLQKDRGQGLLLTPNRALATHWGALKFNSPAWEDELPTAPVAAQLDQAELANSSSRKLDFSRKGS